MQAQKMTLSKREKRLIFIAGCIGVLVIMVAFVIIPLNNNLAESTRLHGELAARKTQLEIELAGETELRENHAAALASFEQIQTDHNRQSLTSEIGLMLTQKVKEHNLEPISQNISQPTGFQLIDFAGQKDEHERLDVPVFSVLSVTMLVSGEYEDAKSLLNTVEGIRYLRASNVNLRFSADGAGRAETNRINIRFDMLMLMDDLIF